MINLNKTLISGVVAGILLGANTAHAHVSYNTSASGGLPGTWTDGAPAYGGSLQAFWVANIHNTSTTSDTQTASTADAALEGAPIGYKVEAGGRAWADGTSNWGQTTAFGLINLAHGADQFSITVSADGSDFTPAFTLWKGWDSDAFSNKHQPYANQCCDNPLETTGLAYVTFGASATAGGSLTHTLNNLQAGKYTLFVGGNNGTAGMKQYSASFTAAPVPLPAAVWLFGGTLMSFLGLQRRKLKAAVLPAYWSL